MKLSRKNVTFFSGLAVLLGGFALWVADGMPTDALIPGRKTFGSNEIHVAYFGVLLLIYSFFEWLSE